VPSRCMILTGLLTLLAPNAAPSGRPIGEDSPSGVTIEIEACSVGLTEAGRSARYQEVLIYKGRTDAAGAIADLALHRGSDVASRFVALDDLEACIRNWRLGANSQLHIAFTVGTSLGVWTIDVSPSEGPRVVVRLPR